MGGMFRGKSEMCNKRGGNGFTAEASVSVGETACSAALSFHFQ